MSSDHNSILKFHKTEARVNELYMRTQDSDISFLLVEGSDDDKFFNSFIDLTKCEVYVTDGKDNMDKMLSYIQKMGKRISYIAIQDADFRNIYDDAPTFHGLFITDDHDIEMTTFRTDKQIVNKVVRKHIDSNKLKLIKESIGKNIIEILLSAAIPIGYLRLVNEQYEYCIDFENLKYSKFINTNTLCVDLEQLADTACRYSSGQPANRKQELIDCFKGFEISKYDAWQICCGHDVIEILSLFIKKLKGKSGTTELNPPAILRDTRLAYREEMFLKTKLNLSIMDYQNDEGILAFI